MTRAEDLPAPRWLLATLTLVGTFLSTFTTSSVAVAMPVVGKSLSLDFSTAIFVQVAYLLTATIFLIPAGRFADAYGRHDFYLAGLVVLGAGSLAAGLAPTAAWLIAARCVQGVGAALVAGTNEAILVTLFPARERGRAIGINVTVVYLGIASGPVIGGLLADRLGWRWIFLVNVPVALAALALAARPFQRLRERHAGLKVDLAGVALLAAAAAPAIVALTYAPLWGWGSALTVALLAAGAAALAAFLLVETYARDPILELRLLRRSADFTNASLATLLNAASIFAVGLLVALFLELVQGRSVATTGLLLLAQPAVMAVLSPVFGRLYDRVGSRVLASGGMLAVAAGLFLLAGAPDDVTAAEVVVYLALVGLGMAAFSSPNEAAALGAVPPAGFGSATAIVGTARYVGQFLSLSVLGAVAASRLGEGGARVIFLRSEAQGAAAAYAHGFRIALVVAGGLAVLTAAVVQARAR